METLTTGFNVCTLTTSERELTAGTIPGTIPGLKSAPVGT
jgi:hypothetical protein